jgi:hypothetical protein
MTQTTFVGQDTGEEALAFVRAEPGAFRETGEQQTQRHADIPQGVRHHLDDDQPGEVGEARAEVASFFKFLSDDRVSSPQQAQAVIAGENLSDRAGKRWRLRAVPGQNTAGLSDKIADREIVPESLFCDLALPAQAFGV